ncbi:hypothetical protein [Sphingobacterium paramultivorum]|uniref:hypothetical protein n=1 Tax=Sphingobacterium paramultivorum TaxID=2886510 RepID=UPI00129C1A6E|nr:hypothetical protein [Sphingobacterium paramultivorum]
MRSLSANETDPKKVHFIYLLKDEKKPNYAGSVSRYTYRCIRNCCTTGPEDLPNDVPDNPEEELSENEPDETPEMPDQDDLGIDEELGDEEENEFPKLDEQEEDERELDNNGSI